jgi:hypothetical protein
VDGSEDRHAVFGGGLVRLRGKSDPAAGLVDLPAVEEDPGSRSAELRIGQKGCPWKLVQPP